MNKILYIGATILSIMSANTPLMAVPIGQSTPTIVQGTAPKGNDVVAEFECRSRGVSIGEIVFTADRQYNSSNGAGKYTPFTNSFGRGYRLLTGPIQRKSIVRQKGGIFLVATKQEKQAAKLAARDAALICNGGEINY
jgi:hypothetical protein